MPQLRIALAQVNPTVGDLAGNADLVVRYTRRAAERGASLVAFPEMVLTGYPVEDLALRASFVDASRAALHDVAGRLAREGLAELPVIVGHLDRLAEAEQRVGRPAGAPLNAAAVLHRGGVAATYAKHHLPNYGVFDEFRYFIPGGRFPVLRLRGVDVGLAICEDLWQDGGPVTVARQARVGLLAVANASPYEAGKLDARVDLARRRAREAGATLAFVNMVGGQDELVFDGGSVVVEPDGELAARAPQFEQTLLVADLDLPPARDTPPVEGAVDAADGTAMTTVPVALPAEPLPPYEPAEAMDAPRLGRLEEIYTALVTGTRDYARKNGFASAILALSGGIDSALTATVAADAVGPANVHAVLLPSRYSSEHSVRDAE
ncbi:MAG: nitrilase-related carbon-nitrogen hydrolase, partial [Streptosporangiaceae bacterium]